VHTGIVTGKSRSSWDVTIAETQLGEFDVVVVDDDVAEPKPHPEGIMAALRTLRVSPQDAVYIGDSPADMEAAQAAGTYAAAAMWSKNDAWRERFLARTAGMQNIVLLDQPAELFRYFRISTTSREGARSSSVR
jgi:phosphoglycolate phosphatase-like HAD superfamily hydrolase